MVAAAAISAVPSVLKSITGAFQAMRGRRMLKNLKRPDYEIPDEFNQNVKAAKTIKNLGGLSEAALSRFRQDAGRNFAAGLQGLRGRGGAVAGIAGLNQNAMDAAGRLAMMDSEEQRANFKMGTQLQMNALGALASQKLAQQNWNKFLPFQEKRAEAQALIGAGMQNTMGGFGEISSLAMNDLMWNDGKGFGGFFGKSSPTDGTVPSDVDSKSYAEGKALGAVAKRKRTS